MRLRNKEIVNDSVVAQRPLAGALPPAHPVDGAIVLGVGTRSEILAVIRNFARSVEGAPRGKKTRNSGRSDGDRGARPSGASEVGETERFSTDRWHTDDTRHGLTSYVGFDASWADGPESQGTVRYRDEGRGR